MNVVALPGQGPVNAKQRLVRPPPLPPPATMPLTFGEPSFENHLRTARERGLAPCVLTLPGLGLDIDGPDDLALLLASRPTTESSRLLAGWSIGDRLTV